MTFTCIVSSSTSLTYSLRCIIPAYCIHQRLDKHNQEPKIVFSYSSDVTYNLWVKVPTTYVLVEK